MSLKRKRESEVSSTQPKKVCHSITASVNDVSKPKDKKKKKKAGSFRLTTPTEIQNKKHKKKHHKKTKNIEPDKNWKQLIQTIEKQGTGSSKAKKKKSLKQKEVKPKVISKSETASQEPEIWFDDVDDILIEGTKERKIEDNKVTDVLVKADSFDGLTKVVAIDCEMVGVGEGGKDNNLARVSIVNHFGKCIYDSYVKAIEKVTDYRTHVSGIREFHIKDAPDFETVQREVHNIIKGRLLIGHAIQNDLKVLFLDHPRNNIRDTSRYKPFKKLYGGKTPSLKNLSEKLLAVKVQEGEHSSVQDAQAAMRLYTTYRKQWEKSLKEKRGTLKKFKKLKNEDT